MNWAVHGRSAGMYAKTEHDPTAWDMTKGREAPPQPQRAENMRVEWLARGRVFLIG